MCDGKVDRPMKIRKWGIENKNPVVVMINNLREVDEPPLGNVGDGSKNLKERGKRRRSVEC